MPCRTDTTANRLAVAECGSAISIDLAAILRAVTPESGYCNDRLPKDHRQCSPSPANNARWTLSLVLLQVPSKAPPQVPFPQSEVALQVPAAQVPVAAPLQVEPALRLVQSELAQHVFAGGTQLPCLGDPLQVDPPQSVLFLQAAEQVPVTAPLQVALALKLVQSALAKQLLAVGTAVADRLTVACTHAAIRRLPCKSTPNKSL